MIKTLGSPFKFFGYYYLNRSSIRHANPINDVRFQRLVITIFGVTGLVLFLKVTTFQSVFFISWYGQKKRLSILSRKPLKNCSWCSRADNFDILFLHVRWKWKHALKFCNLFYERNPLEIEQQGKIDYDCFQTFCESKKIHEITNTR